MTVVLKLLKYSLFILLFSNLNAQTKRAIMEGTPATNNTIIIDTTNIKIGIKKINPSYELDVNGYINAAKYFVNNSTMVAILPGTDSIAYGVYAGLNNTGNYNTFIGNYVGRSNTTGGYNTFLGYASGQSNTTGWYNTFVGGYAGNYNQTGTANCIFGYQAGGGVPNNSFSNSTIIGYRAGYGLTTGSDNIFLGYQAGYNVTTGTGNIVIGYNQNPPTATSNNTLNIGGLIFGTDMISGGTGGKVGIGTAAPNEKLEVTQGNIYINNNAGDPALYIRKGDSPATNKFFGIGFTVDRLSLFQDSDRSYPWITEALVVKDGGNVGIGTTNPAYKLDVSGDVRHQGNSIFNSSIIINANPNQAYALTIDSNSNSSDGYIVDISTVGKAKFYAYLTVDQSISEGAIDPIKFNNVVYNNNFTYDSSTGRIYFKKNGYYLIISNAVARTTFVVTYIGVGVYKNGSRYSFNTNYIGYATNNHYVTIGHQLMDYFTTSDYIEIRYYHGGGTQTIVPNGQGGYKQTYVYIYELL